jgi:CHAD domain-containing protein
LRERCTGSGAMLAGLHRAANTWLRQLKKIRRAAGKVRDLDVHRKIIDQAFLHPQQKPSAKKQAAQGSARSTASAGADRLPKQAETVDHWLKTARKRQQSKLEKTLAKRQPKLTGARQAFLAALPPPEVRATTVGRPIADLARADFDRLLRQMPTLDAGNLHDFRKQAKKARYLAESAGEDDREAHALAEEIKRAQDAIGEWHDWLLLCDESKAALGKHGAQLRKTIAAETNRLFTEALRISTEVRARLTQPPPQTAHPTLSA